MIPLIQNNRRSLQKASQKYGVNKLYLFGFACSNNFSEESDIDFLVSFDKNIPIAGFADNYFEFQKELEEILGRKVDLITERSLHNPFLKRSINRTKKMIYDPEGKEVSL